MYKIYGDYAYTTETLLEQFETLSEAVRWCEGYTDAGDFGGYTVIEIARFAGDEYVVERRYDAEDYEDETVFYEGDDDFALMEEF
jgi:hypothetical protein